MANGNGKGRTAELWKVDGLTDEQAAKILRFQREHPLTPAGDGRWQAETEEGRYIIDCQSSRYVRYECFFMPTYIGSGRIALAQMTRKNHEAEAWALCVLGAANHAYGAGVAGVATATDEGKVTAL